MVALLFQIPQRYRFSSKSQQCTTQNNTIVVVLDTTKVQIFKQITTQGDDPIIYMLLFQIPQRYRFSSKSQRPAKLLATPLCCFRYHKGTDFQANHNWQYYQHVFSKVVLDTTKVQIFKQITTADLGMNAANSLFQIPQRYRFSSKSQLYGAYDYDSSSCFRYHKGTDFQANHNQAR